MWKKRESSYATKLPAVNIYNYGSLWLSLDLEFEVCLWSGIFVCYTRSSCLQSGVVSNRRRVSGMQESGSARGLVEYQYTRKKSTKYPKFLQIYPKIIKALNTLYPKLEVSETNTYLVVLPFLAFFQMDCHYFPTITDHKKRPHVSLKGKMVDYG